MLREEFLRRIHWDCGLHALDGVIAELQAGLIRYGTDRLNISPADRNRLIAAVLQQILNTIVQPGPRRLTDTDLLVVLSKATQVSLSRGDVDALLRAAAERLAGDREDSKLEATSLPSILEPERDILLPTILAERRALIADVFERTRGQASALSRAAPAAARRF
jgi:hypothetical protein